MVIFDPLIFDPFIFGSMQIGSTTETSVVERKKSRGRTRRFLKFDITKFSKVFNAYESKKSVQTTSFKPVSLHERLEVKSIRLQDLDAESLMKESKDLIVSAASKTADIKTVRKTIQTVSMKPKRVKKIADEKTLLTQARELIESAQGLLEKPSVKMDEPSIYGSVPMYYYGEVEFRLDRKLHKEPDECDDYNGQVFSYGPDGLEDGAPIPPLHPNCLLPDTKCEAPGGIVAGLRAWYDGPVIEVEISNGTRLCVTPNHNLLTPHGWVSANLLGEGDEIICQCVDDRIISRNPNINRKPASIEEIFVTLQKAAGMTTVSVPMAAEYLHGDARLCKGYIDIVGSKRLLWNCSNSPGLQHAKQLALVYAQLASPFNTNSVVTQLLKTLVTAADSVMGGNRIPATYFNSRLGHVQDTSVTYPTLNNTEMIQARDDDSSRTTENISQCLDRSAGIIEPQKVVGVNIKRYRGHVYDLQTIPTAYFAEGIIVSNCGCTLVDTKTGQILWFPGSEWDTL